MAFDSLSLSIIVSELSSVLIGGKITKIQQPEKDEITLSIYNKGNYRLLISANASINRIHLTSQFKDNPQVAPNFCMLLRKHLTNAQIIDIKQMPYERVVELVIDAKNELGYKQTKRLIYELTGKTANIILTDEDYRIIDMLKHLPTNIDAQRILLVGATYKFFCDRGLVSIDQSARIAQLVTDYQQPIDEVLTNNILGISKETVRELLYGIDCNNHSPFNADRVVQAMELLITNIARPIPNILFVNNTPVEVYPFDYVSVKGQKKYYDTLNQAHESYYVLKDRAMRFCQKSKVINTTIKNTVARLEKKIALQMQDLHEAQDCTENRIKGDLIIANLHCIPKGLSTLNAVNYYQPDCPTIAIALDKGKTAQQNAQDYYKKYHKQKNTIIHVTKLIEENTAFLDYVKSIAQSIKMCQTNDELAEIYEEMVSQGIIKGKRTADKSNRPSQPLKYLVGDYTLLVGKNNCQNDLLARRLSKADDLWLHTHQIHSAHGIILTQGRVVPDAVLVTCAEIIAHYSEAADSGKTVIDYTKRKYLNRPPASPLGYVIYTQYNTIIVEPNAHKELLSH